MCIFFSVIIMLFCLGMYPLLEHYEEIVMDSGMAEYQYVLKEPYVTNFFLTPGVSEDRCGQDRYDKLEKKITENGGVFRDMSDAMQALAEVAEGGTRWSAVFNLTDRSLCLALEHNYENSYFFSLNDSELKI